MPPRTSRIIRTLMVEDDPAIAALHSEYFRTVAGFELIAVAADLAQAVEVLQRESPDLVLLDVRLPDGTGIDLLRAIRKARPEAFDVIMTTAVSDRVHVESALRLGVVDYLVKPFTRPEFERRLGAYREGFVRRAALGEQRALSQAEVDDLRGLGPEPGLPKGLSEATLEVVAQALADDAPRTATEVADLVGLSRVSARRYLEQLVTEGRLASRPRYGGTGRPSTEYVRV